MSTTAEPAGTHPGALHAHRIQKLCEHLERTANGEDRSLLCTFTREFLAKAPRALLFERAIEDLAAMMAGAFRFLERASAEGVNVEVLNPEEEGWSAPVTLIRAEVSDRPFVVDTIREYLNGENLPIQQYIYRVIGVERAPDGALRGVMEPDRGDPRSLVHCEVARIDVPERMALLERELARRLRDVVAATEDFEAMLAAVNRTIAIVEARRAAVPGRAAELDETLAFLRWLIDGNFVFLGYRAYDIVERGAERAIMVEPGSGLGILRRESESTWKSGVALSEVGEELRRRILEGPALITSKTNAESTVHRRVRMDYVGVKKFDARGEVVGEYRFLGLLTSKAYSADVEAIPILRRKLQDVLDASGAQPGSHDYKEIITIFNSMPKEDLFLASSAELDRDIQMILGHLFSDEVHVSLRPDPLGRGLSIMSILPRGRFSGEVRHRIQDALIRRFDGQLLNYHLAMGAGDQARLHFYLSAPPEAIVAADPIEVAADIRQIIRSWEDRLLDALRDRIPGAGAREVFTRYSEAFPEEYRAATLPEIAVQDVEELERVRLEGTGVGITLREPRGRGRAEAFRGVTVLKLYLIGGRLVLSDFMPILENAGLRVIEVVTFALSVAGQPEVMIYSFAVQTRDGEIIPVERTEILAETLLAVRRGDATNDYFNALVVQAGLRWREADLIRTYASYAFQAGIVPTRFASARALSRYPNLARLLVDYFHARFEPGPDGEAEAPSREERSEAVKRRILSDLDAVTTLTDDRAIRRLAALMEATVRTNYFSGGAHQPTVRSGGVPYLSIKIREAAVEELRRTRLLFEVFVHSARMEGIHLRGAAVSRGGIRWSDRPDDFRTEVLGLVQTQIVKNAVIVPGGSKGGFVTKRYLPTREEMQAEAAEQYRTLIRGMLDLTDNLVDGVVTPPPLVVRHDGDDPYLVVAADKGTAHLSDTANAVAAEYDFWLGDGFASGGSQGYDHKREGITARGAWECVRRHFRELGTDIQREPFTVAGIGDMSGDVFGNGMLLSRTIRLIAAFDHRHVFIDPDPDPERSWVERQRLFKLDRSSWADYDREALSPGAMVVPRATKAVELTPEARAALGLDASVGALDGEALVRAVLAAPVDLLWNGGIGTYVKDREETNAEAGDSTNDPVRVNAEDLRCRVVGEGGNLGMTQRARITYALRGGRLNTDALDNSAGVDMSDHEVNLKILVGPLVSTGRMSEEARNALLHALTDDVSKLVLSNNVQQSLAISLDEVRSREHLGDFAALISSFERERLIERTREGIPGSEELEDRAREGIGLMRPTLSVLLAHAKLQAKAALLDSPLPDDPATQRYLHDYFPGGAVEAVGLEALGEHRLRREIIATELVNDLVDLMGSAFLHRVSKDTGRTVATVATAWYIASRMAGAAEIREDLERFEGRYPTETIYRWWFGLARVLERTTRWTLTNVEPGAAPDAVISDIATGMSTLRQQFGRIVAGEDRALFRARRDELLELGLDGEVADRIVTLRFLPELLDILRIAKLAGTDSVQTGEAYYRVADFLGVSWIQQTLRGLRIDETWDKRLAQTAIADLQRAHRGISTAVLRCRRDGSDIEECLTSFLAAHEASIGPYLELLEELRGGEPSLAACTVAIHALLRVATI